MGVSEIRPENLEIRVRCRAGPPPAPKRADGEHDAGAKEGRTRAEGHVGPEHTHRANVRTSRGWSRGRGVRIRARGWARASVVGFLRRRRGAGP
eukprot:3994270-Pyramimonas_sp.AAC.1